MATHRVVTSGSEPTALIYASRANTTGGSWDIENLGPATVFIGHEKVSTNGENRGWCIAPGSRTKVDLVSALYVVSDEPADVLAFKASGDGPTS